MSPYDNMNFSWHVEWAESSRIKVTLAESGQTHIESGWIPVSTCMVNGRINVDKLVALIKDTQANILEKVNVWERIRGMFDSKPLTGDELAVLQREWVE